MKDGPKNRLREQDIHKIVDVFTRQDGSDPGYARMVGFDEIEKNDFNLNLPRYIDSSQAEDLQDIEGHLQGGIPAATWMRWRATGPSARSSRPRCSSPSRPGYLDLAVEKSAIKTTHLRASRVRGLHRRHERPLRRLARRRAPRAEGADSPASTRRTLIAELSESLLTHYADQPLIDPYDIYQHLMDYWAETMQDDAYLIAADGWKAETYRIIETDKKGKEKDKGWACDLLPKPLLVARYFANEQARIDRLERRPRSRRRPARRTGRGTRRRGWRVRRLRQDQRRQREGPHQGDRRRRRAPPTSWPCSGSGCNSPPTKPP